jgi:hypothetical protein
MATSLGINSINGIVDLSVFYFKDLYMIEVFTLVLMTLMKIQVKSKEVRIDF